MILVARRVATVAVLLVVASVTGCSTRPTSEPASTTEQQSAQSSPVAMPVVVTIGDSIMKGFGVAPPEAWPALVSESHHWTNFNLACNGEGFVAVGDPEDCDGPFETLALRIKALQPTTVILSGSSNDFGIDNEQLKAATESALQSYRRALPHVQIIALSTVWGDTEPPAQLADVDAQVREATAEVGGTFIDIGQPLAGHPELLQTDDVHPTTEGHQKLAEAISAALSSHNVNLTAQQ